jgi:succinate-semialdehyde dehydrogenase
LHGVATLLSGNREDLSRIITLEQGKPLRESREEVDYAASFLRWFAEEGKRHYGQTIPSYRPGARMLTVQQPIGVTAAITPWNWPLAMIARKAAAALAAGCPTLVKPAPETPFSAIALANLAWRAGVPREVLQLVVGEAESICTALMENESVRAVSFTGSTRVGKLLLRQSANTVKRMALELGGQAPFIICPDADLDAAISAAIAVKFEASGQNCIGLNRAFVHEKIYDAVCEALAERSRALKVGDGMDETVDMGPLTTRAGVDRCHALVADAVTGGARLVCGGRHIEGPGNFYMPTVIADVRPDMQVARTEIFGPVLPLTPYRTIEEAIGLANDSECGLAAYVYTRDMRSIFRFLDDVQVGMIGFNTHVITGPPVPFGGVKEAGLGREGSSLGLADFTEIKYACLGGVPYDD